MADAPIGGRSFGEAVRFESLSNRNPTESLRTHNRFDPYWDGLWSRGTTPLWMSHARAQRQAAAGIGRIPSTMHANLDPEAAADVILSTEKKRQVSLDVLGALDTWRTMTAQQLAAMTGHRALAGGASHAMREMFSAELVDTGLLTNGLTTTAAGGAANLYRPSRTDAFADRIRERITYPEWVSVTGGTPFESGRQFDRHNLLSTEVALRFAEYTDVVAVLGEKLSSTELLGYTGIGFDTPERMYQRGGDLTLVRDDGMRIVVEMTASRGSDLGDKVRRWAKLLHDRRMSDSGLAVVFLSAEHPDTSASKRWNVRNGVFRYIAQAVREYPGVSFDRTAGRIGVADWREWFPEPGMVSPAFLTMEVDVATGEPSSPWERRSFLDIFDQEFSPKNPDDFTAVIDNSALLRGSPTWLRKGRTVPDLTPAMHARSDYAHLSLESLRVGYTHEQQRWFDAPLPPVRMRG